MKRLTSILLFLTLILSSCHKAPEAQFSTDNANTEVGQTVYFNNNSHYGDRYDWDFGDGFVSSERSPAHTFDATGSFEVVLTVTSKNGDTDEASLVVNVTVPTFLVVEVREFFSNDLVPNASIILYPTLTDWDNQTNSVMEAFSDANGVAVFAHLDPFVFYADVWETTHDNYQLRSEDVGWVRTPEVLAHQITQFLALVDIADHSSGVKGDRKFVIKKLIRKADDGPRLPAYPGNSDWRELLKRSVGK